MNWSGLLVVAFLKCLIDVGFIWLIARMSK